MSAKIYDFFWNSPRKNLYSLDKFCIARVKIKTCCDYSPEFGWKFQFLDEFQFRRAEFSEILTLSISISRKVRLSAIRFPETEKPRIKSPPELKIFQRSWSLIIWADPTSNGLTYFSYVLSYVICSWAPVFGLYRIAWPPNNFFWVLKNFPRTHNDMTHNDMTHLCHFWRTLTWHEVFVRKKVLDIEYTRLAYKRLKYWPIRIIGQWHCALN